MRREHWKLLAGEQTTGQERDSRDRDGKVKV